MKNSNNFRGTVRVNQLGPICKALLCFYERDHSKVYTLKPIKSLSYLLCEEKYHVICFQTLFNSHSDTSLLLKSPEWLDSAFWIADIVFCFQGHAIQNTT